MTTHRYEDRRGIYWGKRRKGFCTWCGKPVPKGRISWCSQACVDEYLIRRNGAALRDAVFRRDAGICARCGLDTERLRRALGLLQRWVSRARRQGRLPPLSPEEYGRSHSGPDRLRGHATLWEADHIVPVVEGGGACGLENLRTLCWWCHRVVTAELAARRASPRTRARRALAAAQQTLPVDT